MNSGYIKLYRSIQESPVFADADLLRLFVWLMTRANFRPGHFSVRSGKGTRLVEVAPGQLVTGRIAGASDLGWPPSTFRNRLERLKDLGMVTTSPITGRCTVVTITNWNKYQVETADPYVNDKRSWPDKSDSQKRTGQTGSLEEATMAMNTVSNAQEREAGKPVEDKPKALPRTNEGQSKDTIEEETRRKRRSGSPDLGNLKKSSTTEPRKSNSPPAEVQTFPASRLADRVRKLFDRLDYHGTDGWVFWNAIAAIDAELLTAENIGRALAAAGAKNDAARIAGPPGYFRTCLAEKSGKTRDGLTKTLKQVKIDWEDFKPGAKPPHRASGFAHKPSAPPKPERNNAQQVGKELTAVA